MTDTKKRDTKKRNQRILFALIAAIASVAIVVPSMSALLFSRTVPDVDDLPTPTTTAPVVTIKPLPVRPVVSAFVTSPEQCPPPDPVPPAEPARICDITRTAVYELGPEALQLQLIKVEAFRNPLTGVQVVQMSMTDESAKQFAAFTAERVGQQVAFVRGGTVVWGPKITAPIDGTVLQLSGDITPEQAKDVARMLRDGS